MGILNKIKTVANNTTCPQPKPKTSSLYFATLEEFNRFIASGTEEEVMRISPELPCQGQVLRLLHYLRSVKRQPIRTSAHIAARRCVYIWSQERGIPTCDHYDVVSRLERLYRQWWHINKYPDSNNPDRQPFKEDWFLERMGYLFDISARNALDLVQNDEVKSYLRQRFDTDHRKLIDYLL